MATVLLLAPCVAALLVYARPRSLAALLVADALLMVTVVLLLIGYTGFLYVPSLILFGAVTWRRGRSKGGGGYRTDVETQDPESP